MAVENIPFSEAVQFNKNNFVSKAHTFSEVDRPITNVMSDVIAPMNTYLYFTGYSSSFPDFHLINNQINRLKKGEK